MEKVAYEGVDLEGDDVEFADVDERTNTVSEKATKPDDVVVSEHLWNDRIAEKLMLTWKRDKRKHQGTNRLFVAHNPPLTFKKVKDCNKFRWALGRIRSFCLQYWKRKVTRDFDQWFHEIGIHGTYK